MKPLNICVVGGGLVGLTAAISATLAGHRVTVLERGEHFREFGAGIWLWANGLEALHEVGLDEFHLREDTRRILGWNIRDQDGLNVFSSAMAPEYIPSRADLYSTLLGRAEQLGITLIAGTPVRRVYRDGTVALSDGARQTYDLVIGADGYNSTVRNSLDFQSTKNESNQIAMRTLIPRRAGDTSSSADEYWAGNRTLLVTPVDDEHTYVCFVCSRNDREATTVDGLINKESWSNSFKGLASVIRRLNGEERWDSIGSVRCKTWRSGRAVIVGDAAHAMPPTLGQAANTGIRNAVLLGKHLRSNGDVDHMLASWELNARPLTEYTQRWSLNYSHASHMLPAFMGNRLRMKAIGKLGRVPFIRSAIVSPAAQARKSLSSPQKNLHSESAR